MKNKLPGDVDENFLEKVIRVNHAGEYGAKRIYEGQLAVLKKSKKYKLIKHMAEQEEKHLKYFEEQLVKRKIRPTFLLPMWHVAGYFLGVATAALGEKTAMACTEAVEEVIDKHYQDQLKIINNNEIDLKNKIEQFRQEELEHYETAIENDSQHSFGYNIISKTIKFFCKKAICISKEI